LSQLKKGVALSYVIIFLTNSIGLVLTPFIIRSFGKSEYGLYTMIGALVGYMTVLDFGLNSTIIRFVAKYRAEKDKKGEENFLAHSFLIYGFVALIVVCLGFTLYFNLDTLYNNTLTIDQLRKAKIMFLILIFNLAISLPGGAFTGICSGYEEFVLPRIANIIRYILRSLVVVGLLVLGGDAVGIVIIDTIMNLLIIAVHMTIAFKKLNVKIRLHQFEKPLLKLIAGYSVWIFVFAMVHQLRWQFGQLVLGLTFSTSVVAIYAVAVTLGTYYGNILCFFTKSYANGCG
jgi:O-antigen/teichoic acid export membrane protein